jgi:alanine racemase
MSLSRRQFVSTAAAGVALRPPSLTSVTSQDTSTSMRFDPWLEIDTPALHHNVREVARLAGGRPILAVVKNNAYGLGIEQTCPFLNTLPEIAGFAVVKTDAALQLRAAGIDKPILHMGMFARDAVLDLVNAGVQLSLYTDDAEERIRPVTNRNQVVSAHLYVDTGMSRMGIPYHRALRWFESVATNPQLRIRGTFTAFTEDPEFDREQLRRFTHLAQTARSRGVDLGQLHAASSNAVFHIPEAHLDFVRPGIALYGAYPSDPEWERQRSTLRCAFRLRARIVRVEQLRPGDSVSYGRDYVAEQPTWIATLPVGHSDGYTRQAVQGARVLINDQTYPVIGAVSASHTIVEIGNERRVEIGDVATLLGPDVPEIEPNNVAAATGASVYDLLMHLNPTLPR